MLEVRTWEPESHHFPIMGCSDSVARSSSLHLDSQPVASCYCLSDLGDCDRTESGQATGHSSH